MRRRHSAAELAFFRRQERVAKIFHPDIPYLGRKKHVLDCGNPRCGLCHLNKRYGHDETLQEIRARMTLRETA